MKIISIVGARPQFIKVAPISKAFVNKAEHIIVHTGQHYDYSMSKSFFDELGIPEPKYNLEIGSGLPGFQIGNMLIQLEQVFLKEKPDFIIVYGDTNSTAAASIAAVKCNIKLGHVEAGVREFDKTIPEETNKLITDILSDYYFCPSETAVKILLEMGIVNNVYNIGDVMIDLIYQNLDKIKSNKDILNQHGVVPKNYIYVTCHRASNTDKVNNLKEILQALNRIDLPIIFPIHPRTKKVIEANRLDFLINKPTIHTIDPIGFIDSQILIRNAKFVITDSGGITKECHYHKVKGILIDTQTEWIETLKDGWNTQAGPNCENILDAYKNDKIPLEHKNYYGDGLASKKIVELIMSRR